MTPPPDRLAPVRRLRLVATLIVAAALLTAGGWKLIKPDPAVTMLSRYLPSPKAARAAACLEIAIGLWLLSGRSPKLAPGIAAAAIAGMGVLVATELGRDQPLPCGCFPVHAIRQDSISIRHELSVALGRDVFLIALCGVSGALGGNQEEDDA